MYDYIRYSSPLGMLTVAAENGALTALVIEGQKYADRHLAGEGRECETPVLRRARCWLDDYFAGKNPDASALPLSPGGTAFQQAVWQELRKIPYGETESYGAVAARLGSSARAVGSAVGRNPISLIIPCHRVLAADGGLTGYWKTRRSFCGWKGRAYERRQLRMGAASCYSTQKRGEFAPREAGFLLSPTKYR